MIELKNKTFVELKPKLPYNFDANFHKPSHFPSSDNVWEKGNYWITMVWKGKHLGLKFENNKNNIRIKIHSREPLSKKFIWNLMPELRWRFNLDQDISNFCNKFKDDLKIGSLIKKWKGMKPMASNSLYETLIIYIVLQNATVRRSVQMLENLFNKFGKKVKFDNKILSTFWEPRIMTKSSEEDIRKLKVGYRSKTLMNLTLQFVKKEIDEFELRNKSKKDVKEKILKLYGIGPASVEYLLFEDFYFLDALETIPPWEQKIYSRLLFNRKLVSSDKILNFFRKYKPYEKLAFHYVWEDLFWKRKHKHIEWLEKEIRL